jgi:phosphoglycolate/pyridoxal phosphate phosphatase family enzyme
MKQRAHPQKIALVAVDLDGVVYRGGRVMPAAPEALEEVVRRGLDLRYVSNNSTAHREVVSERLAAMGVPAGAARVLTSGFVTARWLRERLPAGSRVLVMGEEGLMRELREVGLRPFPVSGAELEGNAPAGEAWASAPGQSPLVSPRQDSVDADDLAPVPAAVVVGMDRSFSFHSLARTQAAIKSGALFVATNTDPTYPTPDGLVPGAGALVAAVATAAEREPVVMGKPSLALAEVLEDVTGVPASRTLFIGDRLTTDVALGREAGMITALVLTGVTTEPELEQARASGTVPLPDHVMNDLRGLPQLLDLLGEQSFLSSTMHLRDERGAK